MNERVLYAGDDERLLELDDGETVVHVYQERSEAGEWEDWAECDWPVLTDFAARLASKLAEERAFRQRVVEEAARGILSRQRTGSDTSHIGITAIMDVLRNTKVWPEVMARLAELKEVQGENR